MIWYHFGHLEQFDTKRRGAAGRGRGVASHAVEHLFATRRRGRGGSGPGPRVTRGVPPTRAPLPAALVVRPVGLAPDTLSPLPDGDLDGASELGGIRLMGVLLVTLGGDDRGARVRAGGRAVG